MYTTVCELWKLLYNNHSLYRAHKAKGCYYATVALCLMFHFAFTAPLVTQHVDTSVTLGYVWHEPGSRFYMKRTKQGVPGTRLVWSIFFAVQSSFRKTFAPSSFPTVSVSCVYVPSLVPRELPDFSPLLWNEICEWPGNEASVYLFSSPRSTLSRGKTVWWTKLVSTCSCSSVTYSNIQKHFCSKRVKFYCCMEIAMTVILTTSLVLITFWE